MSENESTSLPEQLAESPIVVAPGIYDALGAAMAERAGFDTLYLSGASIAYTRFGCPDIGLVGMSEVAATLSAIKERTHLPVVVDAATGFGNAHRPPVRALWRRRHSDRGPATSQALRPSGRQDGRSDG